MRLITEWFVGNPLGPILVSGVLGALWLLARHSAPRPSLLLWAALAWLAWAGWELAILRFSPEANIRIDLLLIIPVVILGTLLALVLAFRHRGM